MVVSTNQNQILALHSTQKENRKPLGNDLLSRAVSSQVPSALAGLTSGFGMGPGVAPLL